MPEDLHFNVRLEGSTRFAAPVISPQAGAPSHDIDIPTVVLVEAGLSGWPDDPYRARAITEYRGGVDSEDVNDERKFPTQEELCTWLEQYIADLRARGFDTVRYKVNGMPIDWLNRINLPPD